MGNCLTPKDKGITLETESPIHKILLLGAGDSGKTTIYKQVLIIRGSGFSSEDKVQHRSNILNNVIFGTKALITASKTLKIPITEERAVEISEKMLHINLDPISEETPWSDSLGQDIAYLWKDPSIQQCFALKNRFQIIENFDYFMEHLPRLNERNYVPTVQDVLMCRSKSLGIIETDFEFEKRKFKLVDVGGQRTERKKWIHCFENVSAVLFVVALSEYNQVCYEDNVTSRMEESLKLFNEMCRVKYFFHTPIYLLMNKEDIFATKIKTIDPGQYFPKYEGGCDYDQALHFIIDEFLNEKNEEQIKCKILNATDTESVQKCLESILKTINQ